MYISYITSSEYLSISEIARRKSCVFSRLWYTLPNHLLNRFFQFPLTLALGESFKSASFKTRLIYSISALHIASVKKITDGYNPYLLYNCIRFCFFTEGLTLGFPLQVRFHWTFLVHVNSQNCIWLLYNQIHPSFVFWKLLVNFWSACASELCFPQVHQNLEHSQLVCTPSAKHPLPTPLGAQ